MGNCLHSETSSSSRVDDTSINVAAVNETTAVVLNCTNDLDCPILSRLRRLINYYDEWTSKELWKSSEESNTDGMVEYINKNLEFSIVGLIQDYHHLINKHYSEFEQIYDQFNSLKVITCDKSNCTSMERNHRDRSAKNARESYYKPKDRDEIVIQQICDLIHCYIYHTFDMGFKLTRKELIQIEKQDDDDKDNGDDKKEIDLDIENKLEIENRNIRLQRVRIAIQKKRNDGRVRRDENNKKFMTDMDNDKMFSFGIRYFYDIKYKDNDDIDYVYNIGYKEAYTFSNWYIDKKYKHIKEELLNNTISWIEKPEYNDLYMKCKYYMKTEYILEDFKNMTIQCLLSMMIYCNFDTLQYLFSKTYRHAPNQTDDELKADHLEFRNLGYLLQKTVKVNGTEVEKGKTKIFYHGINTELMFTSTLSRFCGPISTSSEWEVACSFTKQKGIILELNDGTLLSNESCSIYFDCEYLSDFAYEKEKFFIGGKAPLKIVSIFHVRLKQNYGTYISLINLLLSVIKGDISINLKERDEKAIVKLLNHELKNKELPIPKYVTKLLHHICSNIKIFTTRFNATFGAKDKTTNYAIFAKFFCLKDCQFFKLDLLHKLFPNLESIAIECSIITDKVFENILKFLKYCKKDNIESNMDIIFSSTISGSIPFKTVKQSYSSLFSEYNYLLEINKQQATNKKYLVIKRNKSKHHKTDSKLGRAIKIGVLEAQSTGATTDGLTVINGIDVFV